MRTKPVDHINFTRKRDPALIAKLNAVAPYERRNVHDLVRLILLQRLDELINEYGIAVDYSQPAACVG